MVEIQRTKRHEGDGVRSGKMRERLKSAEKKMGKDDMRTVNGKMEMVDI